MVAKIIFIIIGIVFVSVGILVLKTAFADVSKHDSWTSQDASITSFDVVKAPASKSRPVKNRSGYSSRVIYSYTYNNLPYEGVSFSNDRANTHDRAYNKVADLKIDQKIQILVNPNNPSESMTTNLKIDSYVGTYFAGAIFITIGFIISIAAIRAKI